MNGRQRILPMRALVRILLGGCGAMVRFVVRRASMDLLLLRRTFRRRSSSDDLPPAIFVTGTRSHNLHLTA